MSKLWEYWKCPNFGQTFGHIWDKCPYFGHIFCYILDKCLSFGHLYGNILDKFQHFRHILDTFWTGVQTLDRLWSQFGRMSLFWQHIGHILYTFWTHYVQIVSILTLFKGTHKPFPDLACERDMFGIGASAFRYGKQRIGAPIMSRDIIHPSMDLSSRAGRTIDIFACRRSQSGISRPNGGHFIPHLLFPRHDDPPSVIHASSYCSRTCF